MEYSDIVNMTIKLEDYDILQSNWLLAAYL